MRESAFFWGCTIQARYPFFEKSTRVVLDSLSIPYCDIDGFTCCPEKSLVETLDEKLYNALAARNIALAESRGMDMLMTCTGCYSTLKSAWSKLKTHQVERRATNNILKELNLEFKGTNSVRHIIEVFVHDIGLSKIKRKLKRSLSRLKIAVHNGCHLVRPSNAINFDDPLKPVKFDWLIEALGGVSLNYERKMACCGGYLDRVNQSEKGHAMASEKLSELSALKADAISVVCPECFKAFDNNQFLMQKKGAKFNIPVITLQELMGLCFGFEPEQLGINHHRIDPGEFLKKFDSRNG